MAFDQTRRLGTAILRADEKAFIGVQELEDYQPHNPACTSEAIVAVESKMKKSQRAEVLAKNAYEAAHKAAITDEWAMHNVILAAKTEVGAQYGADSEAVRSLGLKLKSERKRPRRKGASVEPTHEEETEEETE